MGRLQDILKAYPTDMAGTRILHDIHLVGMQCKKSPIRKQGEKLYKTGDIMYNVNSPLYLNL